MFKAAVSRLRFERADAAMVLAVLVTALVGTVLFVSSDSPETVEVGENNDLGSAAVFGGRDFAIPTSSTTSSTTTTTTTTTTIPTDDQAVVVTTETEGAGTISVVGDPAPRVGDPVVFLAEPGAGEVFERWETEPTVLAGWWNAEWGHRVPVTVAALDGAAVAPVEIDFATLLFAAGTTGTFSPDSIRVVEVDGTGVVTDGLVLHQFVPGALGTAGTLMIDLRGAPGDRFFHVYFDTLEAGHSAQILDPAVSVTDGVPRNDLVTIEIVAGDSTWYFDGVGGGFVSLLDPDGNDWISWNTAAGGAGQFRGIPNAVFPEGYLHPGSRGHVTTIVEDGPLVVVLETTFGDDAWSTTWTIDAAGASMIMNAVDHDYWFLYEGTPGGTLDPDTDVVIRSTGQRTTAGEVWTGDIEGPEWVAVSDPEVGRSILVVNHQEDDAVDSYGTVNDLMTVLGFGRDNTDAEISQVPAEYSVRLVDSGENLALAAGVLAATTDPAVTVGEPEVRTEGELVDPVLQVALTGDLTVTAVFGPAS